MEMVQYHPTTLVENGLEVKEEIARISSVLVANRASYKLRADAVAPLLGALRDALAEPAQSPSR